MSAIRKAEDSLSGIRHLNGDMEELFKRVETLRCEVFDLAEIIRDKREEFDFSPAELDAAEARTDQLYRLKKKYGATVEDMIAYQERCRDELNAMETADDLRLQLEQKLKRAGEAVERAGKALTQARKKAGERLEQRIQKELRELDMEKVRFSVDFAAKEPGTDGCDTVRFLMSANAGEALRPISKIASGGELARIMLALKNVLAEQEQIATLVFDEVDTGISGRAALKVGIKLRQTAKNRQILCVTHLAQIAAQAHHHLLIAKQVRDGRTYTQVAPLDEEGRELELARIIGGEVSEAARVAAGDAFPDVAAG